MKITKVLHLPGVKRDIAVASFLAAPMGLHELFHAVDGLSGWHGAQLMPLIAPLFLSHTGFGFYFHVVVSAMGVVAFAFVFWRMLHYALLAVRIAERLLRMPEP